MSSVDERIVSMKIDNKQFLPGVKESQNALSNLNKSVDSAGKSKGLSTLGSAADGVKHKFSLLNAAAVTAVATITNKVVNAGLHMAKSLTLDPLIAGFQEYQTNLNSIQTIMANTGKGVGVVNHYLNDLNHYSDKTIYNFSEMARNIGTFTAAGVDLKTATSSIKGIANLAALSGSNSQQASTAMYQLSQAIAAGKVGLQDWNSVVNAGMGGKVFQTALARTASNMGVLGKNSVKVSGPMKKLTVDGIAFRESISTKPGHNSWLTSDVLTNTLKQLSGNMTDAQLKAEGFSKAERKAILDMAKSAELAATRIKTFPQMMDVVKESIGSGWAKIFQDIFGNFNQSAKLWTKVGNTITTVVGNVFGAIDKALVGWRKLGGFADLWNGIGNIFKALGNIIHPFVAAFESILPSTKHAGSGLKTLSGGFLAATAWFEKLTRGAEGLGPVFNILAQVFVVALHAIVGIVKYFAALVPLVAPLASGIGSLATDISQVIVQFLKMVDIGGKIDGLFQHVIDGRQQALEPLITTIGKIIAALGALVHGDISGFKAQFQDALSFLAPYGDMVSGLMAKIQGGFERVSTSGGVVGKIATTLANAAGKVREFASGVADMFNAFKGGSADAAQSSTTKLASATTGLADGGKQLIDVLKTIGKWIGTTAAAIGRGIASIFSSLSNWFAGADKFDLMTAFSYILNGAIILMVYKFVKKVKEGFVGLTETWASISGTMNQLTENLKTMQQGVKAKMILEIAAAVGILAAAMWVLSKIPADKLALGLGAIGIMMVELVGSMALLAKAGGKMSLPVIATSLILMATSLVILSGAVAAFGSMPLGMLVKGMVAIQIALLMLVAAAVPLAEMSPSLILAAAALGILTVALTALAGTLLLYSKISWATLLDGIAKMAVAITVLGVAMLVLAEVGPMVLVASVAMGVLSVSLTMLLGTIMAFSAVSWGDFGKGLGMIAIALIAISVAAAIAAIPVAALGVGALLLGVGLLAAGAGIALFAAGLATMAALGSAAFAVISVAIQAFLAQLPMIAVEFAAALVAFLAALAQASPKIANSFVTIISNMISAANRLLPKIMNLFNNFLDQLLKSVNKNAPKMGHTFQVLLNVALTVLRNSIPKMVNTGLDIIQGLLNGISKRMPKIMTTATDIVVKFINGISNHLDSVINAGVALIIKFIAGIGKNAVKLANAAAKVILQVLNGLDAAVTRYGPQINAAGARLAGHIVTGMVGGIANGIGAVADAARNLAGNAISAAMSKLKSHSPSRVFIDIGGYVGAGFAIGMDGSKKSVSNAAGALGQGAIDAATKTLDIHSPSGVFKGLGINVSKGFVNGIIGSLNIVRDAGAQMAKDTFDMVTRTTTDLQLKADAQAAKADALRFAAAITRQKLHNKKLTKMQKAHINAQAKALDNRAQAYANASASSQSGVDAANKREDDQRAFDAADLQGRADILNQRAQDAAASAEASRKNAIKLTEEANRIRSQDAKRAKSLAAQAQEALKNSQSAANAAKTNALQAQQYAIQAVLNSSSSVAGQLNDWLAADAADKAYEAMTSEQKKAEMERRSAEEQKQSDDLIASARSKLAQANALAGTNAQAAQALVDSASADVEAAKSAKDQAEQDAQTAAQLITDAAGGVTDTSASGSSAADIAKALQMPDMTIASSAVFGAQTMFDAYAKALAATSDAAAADKTPGVTFVQNNTSPVALSPTELYRQSKNLLSNAERKLAGAL